MVLEWTTHVFVYDSEVYTQKSIFPVKGVMFLCAFGCPVDKMADVLWKDSQGGLVFRSCLQILQISPNHLVLFNPPFFDQKEPESF